MRYCCPDHINGNCMEVIDQSPFREVREKCANKHHFLYQVKCECGCYVFRVVCDKNPVVVAECPNCGKKITVFDQKEYTTGSEPDVQMHGIMLKSNSGNELFEVCAMYEYAEEWKPELGEESGFDFNDVSWGTVWVMDEESRKISMVMDKEVE
ncbi:MAG: hypothetical protein IJ486_04025 [Firmicutes bacterium]|nr:hypothetical protein [Bacillota bacterium]